MEMESKRKLRTLSLLEKTEAIKMVDCGKSMRKVAKELGVGRTTLHYIIKNRDKIQDACKINSSQKRLVQSRHPEIETTVLNFIYESREKGEKITGSIIQAIALEAALKMDIKDFSASNGWLFSFFKRNAISINDFNKGNESSRKYKSNNNNSFQTINDSNAAKDENYDAEICEEDDTAYWKNWCCLCGNLKTMSEIEQELIEIIQKLFQIRNIETAKICQKCHSSLSTITEMINKSKAIDIMFQELEVQEKDNFITQEDVLSIRGRYEKGNIQKDSVFFEEIDVKLEPEINDETMSEIIYDEIENDVEENSKYVEVIEEDEKSPKKYIDRSIRSLELASLVDNKGKKKLLDEELYIYQCHICNEKFDRMCFLTNHTRTIHDCLPQVACTCGRYLATWDSLMSHKRKHSSESRDFHCDLCGSSFITKNGLTIHIKFKHEMQQAMHLCIICGKEFKESTTLKNHERTHLPDEERYLFECNICFKKFTQKSSLKIHINSVHENLKTIICHLCSKAFSSKHYLKTHLLTHEIENVHCDICNSIFKNRVSLQNHKVKVHKPKELLNFPCTICEKRFHNRNHLERHMPIHTGIRKYKCTFERCDNAFKWEKDLRNHMSRHYGERRHKCLWCERSFVDGANLRKHKLRYHAEELAEFEAKYGKRRRMKDILIEHEELQMNE